MINTAKLKGRLREKEKTQGDLAKFLGIATSTMNQKLNGERPLDIYEAEKIAEYLDISDTDFCSFFAHSFCAAQFSLKGVNDEQRRDYQMATGMQR